MKKLAPIFAVALAVIALTATSVSAQPYGPPPPPPGQGAPGGGGYQGPPPGQPGYGPGYNALPPRRIGFGIGFGFGIMENKYDDLACDGCSYEPLAGALNLYGGLFLNQQLELILEGDFTTQRLDAVGSNWLVQSSVLLGLKFFINPAVWVKGGLGWSSLSIQYDDYYGTVDDTLSTGGAMMLGLGYELFRMQNLAIDGNFKFTAGSYESLEDEVYSGTFNLGFNWYL